jgi:hypothetical protein
MTDIQMKSKSDLTPQEQIEILEMEIAAGEKLLSDRRAWLHNAFNKKKSTYSAIATDTRELQEKIDEKKSELTDLKKKIA